MPKKLTTAEVFYLNQNPFDKSVKELAKELGFNESIIKKYLSKPVIKAEREELEEVKRKPMMPDEDADSRMGKRIKNGQVIGTVMTPGASETGDLARERRGNTGLKDSLKRAIHKPKGPQYSPKLPDYEKIARELTSEVETLKAEIERLKNEQ